MDLDSDLINILVNISFIHDNVFKIYEKVFSFDYNRSTDVEFLVFIQNNLFDFLKSIDFPNIIVISYNTSRSPIGSVCAVYKLVQLNDKCSFTKLQ